MTATRGAQSEMEPQLSALGGWLEELGEAIAPRAGEWHVRRYLGSMVAAVTVILYSAQPSAWAAPRGAAPAEPKFEEPHGADLNAGKSPAEVFRSDCGVCHKTPQGLAKDQRSLGNFLRQHYTTGQPQADAMASYLASIGGGGAPATPVSPVRGGPDKPERPPAAVGSRRPAGEPADGPGQSEKKRAPVEQASRPAEPKPEAASASESSKPEHAARTPESKPVEPPKPQEAAKPAEPQSSAARRRAAQPAEGSQPGAPPAATPAATPSPARRGPKIEEAAKPAAPDKPAAAAATPATRTAEPAPPPPPAAVQQPATPPPPQIPL